MDKETQSLVLAEIEKLAAMTAKSFAGIEEKMATKDDFAALRKEMKTDHLNLKVEMGEFRLDTNQRLDVVDRRLDGVETRLSGVEGELRKLPALEQRVAALEAA